MKMKACFKHNKIKKGDKWERVDDVVTALNAYGGVAYIEECPVCQREKQQEKEYWENRNGKFMRNVRSLQ